MINQCNIQYKLVLNIFFLYNSSAKVNRVLYRSIYHVLPWNTGKYLKYYFTFMPKKWKKYFTNVFAIRLIERKLCQKVFIWMDRSSKNQEHVWAENISNVLCNKSYYETSEMSILSNGWFSHFIKVWFNKQTLEGFHKSFS